MRKNAKFQLVFTESRTSRPGSVKVNAEMKTFPKNQFVLNTKPKGDRMATNKCKTRKEAVAAGETFYYTGRPCKNGHDGPRYAKNGICAACASANIRAYRRRQRLRVSAGLVSVTVMVPAEAVDTIKQTAALLQGPAAASAE